MTKKPRALDRRREPLREKRLRLHILGAAAGLGVLSLFAQSPVEVPQEVQALVTIERGRLAASGRFYLELALSASQLSLCHSGVAIATYPVQEISVGRPRIFFFPTSGAGDWIGEVWTQGHLEPAKVIQRQQIIPGGADDVKPGYLPPTLEELIPAPPVYSIQFSDTLAVRVIAEGPLTGSVQETSTSRERWDDFLAALGFGAVDRLRVRLLMQGADSASLYRSFPDDPPDLLIVP
jgi:hypothetical protein